MLHYKRLDSPSLSHIDIDSIDKLFRQLHNDEEKTDLKDIAETLNQDSLIVWTAQKGKEIVGMITMNIKYTLEEKSGYIDDFVVLEEFRGLGIGRGLLTRILELAEKQGLVYVDLTSNPNNPNRMVAHIMYKEFGFEVIGSVNSSNYYRKQLNS